MIRRNILWPLTGFCLVGFLFWTSSCTVHPAAGRQELILLSESDEIALGKEADAAIVQDYGTYEDPTLTAYLNDLCQQLGRISHRPHLTYQFRLLDVSVVNAFALPGGYVHFSRAILATLNSEAELVAVMAHEIGHTAARHPARQYSRGQLIQSRFGAGSLLSEVFPVVSGLPQLEAGMLFLRFGREDERQADDLAVEYSSKLGYDGAEMASFFETLERLPPDSGRSGLPGWFSTHPGSEDRAQAVRKRAAEWRERLGIGFLKVNHQNYLRRIDGLVFGEDPRQGYIEDNVFYHPGLRFQFPVPRNWKVIMGRSQFQIVSEGQEAVLLVFVTSGSSPREAAGTFFSGTGLPLIYSEGIESNNLPAFRAVSEIHTQKGPFILTSSFIEKDKQLFVFHGLAPRALYRKYEVLLNNAMRQFKSLSAPERVNVQPDRIRVSTTRKTETLENALQSLGIPIEKRREMVLLNGGNPHRIILEDTLLKVVEKGR